MPVRRLVIESFLFYLLLRVIVRLEDDNKLVKTEYKPLMRSMAFIIPSGIRFFTPVSWAGILLMEILFFCQAIDVFGNNDVCSWKYTRYRLAISFVLIVSTTLICVMEDIRGYRKYKRNRGWVKIQKPVKTEKYARGTGNIIEQFYYDKAATDCVNGTVIILPYTHNVDPNGDFCINGQRNDIKINTRYGYVYEYDTYYENIMPYDELTDILNESGYNVIRFRFADDNKGRDIEAFCMEIKDIVEKRSLKHILLLGHGAEGCIEAEILSTYISVSGMVLLCGAAVGIMESIRQRESIMVKGKPWFNFRDRRWGKNYLNNLDRLPLGKECATCISKERCGGYCCPAN